MIANNINKEIKAKRNRKKETYLFYVQIMLHCSRQNYSLYTILIVERSKVIENLTTPNLVNDESPYEIVKTVQLATIDCYNYITNMVADRQFIEVCTEGNVMKCMLDKCKGKRTSIYVVLEHKSLVKRAALYRRT